MLNTVIHKAISKPYALNPLKTKINTKCTRI
jgi:hypothetical protein